ncbi:MAG: DEAD/DEAH box helicase [Bacteroidota bacterium]
MKQFKAGYIVDGISNLITDNFKSFNYFNENENDEINKVKGLLQNLSAFDVQFPYTHAIDYNNIHPVLATINNIITRGLPTKAPLIIEEKFVEINLINANKEEFEFIYSEPKKIFEYKTVFELLHLIQPRLAINKENYGGSLDSHLEWQFIGQHPFLIQILQSQRDFATITPAMAGGRSVDFSFTSPYLHWNAANDTLKNVTRIFEVDGPHHLLNEYVHYDNSRDIAAEEVDAKTYRFTKEEILSNEIPFEKLISRDIYTIFEKNFNRNHSEYLEEYSLIYIPPAVARIQKAIIEHFIAKPDLLNKELLQIAIIERDLPCGALAIKSLEDFFKNINAILEEKDKLLLPKIELSIFENEKWVINQKLHCNFKPKNEAYFGANDFDVIIDHSILRRSQIYKEKEYSLRDAIVIRSSHYFDNSAYSGRKVYCSNLLDYKSLVNKNGDGSYSPIKEHEKNINFFIQNIFRKTSFREGQLPIISRAIQQKPVIGLLPTGGGKSLTYQLPAFLQPGLCLVVDPIKSLMEDQVRVLKESWIDCCEYINSAISTYEKRKRIIDFRLGETLFFFVSPERFIMEDFRNVIKNIDGSKFGLGFSFCVIDEVHCVSEWGHDFRYTYLMLGKNAQKFCKIKNPNKKVTLIGLTATASFDVLTDIERELQIKNDDNDVANAIIMIENTIRPELFFKIIDVTNKDRIESLNKSFSSIGRQLSQINNQEILTKSQLQHFQDFEPKDFALRNPETNEFEKDEEGNFIFQYNDKLLLKGKLSESKSDDFYTITFCSVKGTSVYESGDKTGEFINKRGVRYIHQNLSSNSKGYYYANDEYEVDPDIQDYFLNFTTKNGSIHHMVCTKAFGMGIDKSNIRSTYHYNYSSSLESFVQECGRAGRDKKVALANILIDTNFVAVFDLKKFFEENSKLIDRKIRFILRLLLANNLENKDAFIEFIRTTDFNYKKKDGDFISFNENQKERIRKLIIDNIESDNSCLYEKYIDRDIHNYFYKLSFKGVDFEKTQVKFLFTEMEFINQPGFEEQKSLKDTFNETTNDTFEFVINQNKLYEDILFTKIDEIKAMFFITGDAFDKKIREVLNKSLDLEELIFNIDKEDIKHYEYITEENKKRLEVIFYRDRHTGDTGRLIYRLHAMGFLIDYTYDYRIKIYHCTFKKEKYIDVYIGNIESYLRRYLSENSTLVMIKELKSKITFKPENYVEDILECLYFLAEFSYKEIAEKRKRATDEIQDTLIKAIGYEDWFEQNKFIKEQIYFYFNAKYARKEFIINKINYSLLADYSQYSLNKMNASSILDKYIAVFKLEGTEQNNYKHMMGSCKKIMQSLSVSDLKKEWLLRLLKAFSMYAVNNSAYRSEANMELKKGFENLYNDDDYHNNDYDKIEEIFKSYFNLLLENVEDTNQSFQDINLIRNILLQKLQYKGIDALVSKYNEF